ncbi:MULTISPECIES: pilus assembly FimT family protein [Cysteiniphilum]|uniref:Uncharacterized protein n=1 Tax=Cysteiniphilum litorale TaxID=2056700 RepID=A0A8J2Z5B1_9GAMM|nr:MULTISPECIES: prepilin-type N-terminal cleavage/methylation domain-containing protein [Cysteiniphilum]GGG01105.1 hypothetical protein GCM10010995_18150 [Cysteiniphilum litorale]
MNYIKYNFNQKAGVRKNQQGYILISLMASLVILGVIAINEYMHLVKKQQLDRAETAATQIISVASSIGDAIYEPTEMFNKNNALKQDITEIWTKWDGESKKNGGWVTLDMFYKDPNLSAVCGISRPPVSQSQSFTSCVDANKPVNWSSNNGNLFCQCTNQKITYAGFLNLKPINIMLQPIGEKSNETPKSVVLRVPYPELGGKAESGLALRMLANIKKNLIDTPRLKFAVCMGEQKNSLVTPTQFACDVDIDSTNAFDSTDFNRQFIYIHIERKV